MLATIFIAFVLAGTGYAAYLDLKTSEVPDAVSLLVGGGSILFYLYNSLSRPLLAVTAADAYLVLAATAFAAAVAMFLRLHRSLLAFLREREIIGADQQPLSLPQFGPIDGADMAGAAFLALAAIASYLSYTATGMTPLVLSLLSGTALFALGWGMYLAGMWGGADAFVLGAVGYAFPYLPMSLASAEPVLPVPLSLLMLVFAVGAVYSVLYAVYIAFRDTAVMEAFWQRLVDQRRRMALILGGYVGLALVLGQVLAVTQNVPVAAVVQNASVFLVVLAAFLVLYQFLSAVEEGVMRQTIPVDELEPGDVLAEELPEVEKEAGERIVGLTPEQVDRIQDAYDTVDIRSGVRFIVAFPIAILLLIWVGDPIRVLAGLM